MTNQSNKNSKEVQNQAQLSKELQSAMQMKREAGDSSETAGVSDGVQAELSRINTNMEKLCACFFRMMHDRGKELDHNSNGSGFRELGNVGHREVLFDEEIGVQGQIEDMNGGIRSNVGRIESKSFDRMANQIWCSAPISTSDQTRSIDLSFNGGSRELEDDRIRELRGEIENQNLQSKFDSQFRSPSMESEDSHQLFMVDLNTRGDSEASRHYTSNRSSEY